MDLAHLSWDAAVPFWFEKYASRSRPVEADTRAAAELRAEEPNLLPKDVQRSSTMRTIPRRPECTTYRRWETTALLAARRGRRADTVRGRRRADNILNMSSGLWQHPEYVLTRGAARSEPTCA